MKGKIILGALFSGLLAFSACDKPVVDKKNNNDDPKKETGISIEGMQIHTDTIDATNYNQWVYFSFDKGQVVPTPKDPKHDLSWDIAFKRSHVKTNGGTSGMGKAAGYETPWTSFKEIEPSYILSQSKYYVADSIAPIVTDPNQDGNPVYVNESINKDLDKGITLIIRQTDAPLVQYSHFVYFFRSADGKYGAIKFIGYTKSLDFIGALKGGYVMIQYIYPFDLSKLKKQQNKS